MDNGQNQDPVQEQTDDGFKKHIIFYLGDLYPDLEDPYMYIPEEEIKQRLKPLDDAHRPDVYQLFKDGMVLGTVQDNQIGAGCYCYLVNLASLKTEDFVKPPVFKDSDEAE